MQAAQNIVPVAVTAGESIEQLRTWAGGRCLSADSPGIYRNNSPTRTGRRTVATRRAIERGLHGLAEEEAEVRFCRTSFLFHIHLGPRP